MPIRYIIILICSFLTGCSKDVQPIDRKLALSPDLSLVLNPKNIVLRPFTICIDSYEQFIDLVGKPVLAVSKVILQNGQSIDIKGNLIAVTYRAQKSGEASSLFHSQLTIQHSIDGSTQTLFSDVWTLGCLLSELGTPPFTNLLYQNKELIINTCFIWQAPPYTLPGEIIKYLVIE